MNALTLWFRFREEDLLCLSQCKCMGANDPRGGAIFDRKGHDSQDLIKVSHNNSVYQI